ncbi:MAG: hypothetical protein MRY49_00040 [Candidatus Pacebacteria bacterium]|nr:hypothetical protein [Candidatus Paceibacterota bacterium]
MVFLADIIEFITELSTDTLVIIFAIAIFAFLSIYLGKDWIVSFIFSLFISKGITFPFDIGQNGSGYISYGIFLVLAVVITYLIRKFVKIDFPYKKSKKYTQAAILGLVTTIAVMATGVSQIYGFSSFVMRWFSGDYLFYSSLLPFVLLFFVIKR